MPAGTMKPRRVLRWRPMPALLTLVTAGLGSMAPGPQAAAAAASATRLPVRSAGPADPVTVYVVNVGSGTVTPISTATNTVGPPITVGSIAYQIAITPNGKTAYVTGADNTGAGTVTPITTATNTAGTPITVANYPRPIAVAPDGKTVYAFGTTGDPNYLSAVVPISTASNTAGPPITVGEPFNFPLNIAITPDGKTAYLGSCCNPNTGGVGAVTPVTVATNTARTPITVGDPVVLAITPDGKTVYATDDNSNSVTPISTADNTAGTPITIGSPSDQPLNIAITPDGKTAYVTGTDGTVTPISTATNTAGPPIPVGGDPAFIAITPDGKTAYVAAAADAITPIDTATNTAEAPIPLRGGPGWIAITPDGKTAYVATATDMVTPIDTATNTAGPPIPIPNGVGPIAITPATATQAPTFTSGAATTAAFGTVTFTVTTTGTPDPKITRTGRLPSGVKFTDHGGGTATISGIPANAAAGVYPLTLTARNKYGTATQAFTLTVTRAPAIQKIPTIRTRAGAALRLTIRATGYPAPALAESGPLPGGLTFTGNGNGTATIAGTLAAGSDGRYPVTIIATNTEGTATQSFTIVVS
jgi:DNA-binding beta-propeller fold protein YncE